MAMLRHNGWWWDSGRVKVYRKVGDNGRVKT